VLVLAGAASTGAIPLHAQPTSTPSAWTIDHRYAPLWWQTPICLPDDWQKTLVGKEGTLLYDYPGKYSGFKTRITLGFGSEARWVRQELASPRVPIVRTVKRLGSLEITEEAFAAAPPLQWDETRTAKPAAVERMDGGGGIKDWAHPKVPCDAAFRDIAVGWNAEIHYRIRAERSQPYWIVFGLCEGWHAKAGERILDLKIEGKTRKTADMVAAHGKNVPALFAFEAQDEDGDGFIDASVACAAGSPDGNSILNVLWVFQGPPDKVAPTSELLTGKSRRTPLAHVNCGHEPPRMGPPRHDVVLARVRAAGVDVVKKNEKKKESGDESPHSKVGVTLRPTVTVESEYEITLDPSGRRVQIGTGTTLFFPAAVRLAGRSGGKVVLEWAVPVHVPAGEEKTLALGVLRGPAAPKPHQLYPISADQAGQLREIARQYWERADLPYSCFEVPDPGVQAQLDSSIRNIYQAREIKRGLPAFQVGPTCYRGLWVVDGSFLMEAVAYLGRVEEARNGIRYLLSFQRPDGAIMLIDGHLKETGIALWAVTRHARLTGDKAWLAEVWPQIEKGFAYVGVMRKQASADPAAPYYRLLPEGFSDGGLGGKNPEYTNVYWTLVGLKAAVDAARWLGKNDQAGVWQKEYDDFYATFRRAAERDTRVDAHGNRYVPICMRKDAKVSPQKAQWAFLHAVYPGKIFAPDDPLVQGNMAMLRAVEVEGLVRDTGWVANGVWNYFASFYGHGWLWAGHGRKAAQTLYDFANHASPLLAWREEQMPQGEGDAVCGDMPHNWASAEFIRLVRALLILERGDELHLFEGLPPAWIGPGKSIVVRGAVTEFGPMSLEFRVAADGSKAILTLDSPRRDSPKRIVVHQSAWSGKPDTIDLPAQGRVEREIVLKQ
jgi:hypothetical protein